uniref:Uncharacterized protein n=1 Tax=Lepeophtheirus salmonis TaxID=72036 RepID=A0A0K2U4L1_LEPSM
MINLGSSLIPFSMYPTSTNSGKMGSWWRTPTSLPIISNSKATLKLLLWNDIAQCRTCSGEVILFNSICVGFILGHSKRRKYALCLWTSKTILR